jgi:hypothetical protein
MYEYLEVSRDPQIILKKGRHDLAPWPCGSPVEPCVFKGSVAAPGRTTGPGVVGERREDRAKGGKISLLYPAHRLARRTTSRW